MRSLFAVATLVVALLLGGCSSSSKPKTQPLSATRSTVAPLTTTYGQDAALLAAHIRGCSGVSAESTGNGGASGMVGKAACTLSGHQVVIYTWADAASEQGAQSLVAGSMKYFASGTGWIQVLADDAAVDAQKSIAQAVAADLGGTVTGA